MIDVEQYKRLLQEGLLLDHYFILKRMRDGEILLSGKRVQGFINLLNKKEYVKDGHLTDKALNLLKFEPVPETIELEASATLTTTLAPNILVRLPFDYADWVIALHRKCQEKIKAKLGKNQARGVLEGNSYPYLPNSTDLGKVILRVVETYKIKDFAKIEKTILAQVDERCKKGTWFPLLGYYIMKGKFSTMVTDMENIEEKKDEDYDSATNI